MKKKQLFITLTAMALTATLAIGGTLAYMSTITETKENVFSSSDLGGYIEEVFDEETAEKYTPGDVITKAPLIGLESDSKSNAYVASRIVCSYKDVSGNRVEISLEDFQKNYGTLNYINSMGISANGINADAWEKLEGSTGDIYAYIGSDKALKELVAGAKTENLFDTVTVNIGILEQIKSKYASQTVYEETSPGVFTEVEKTESSSQSKALYIKNSDGSYDIVDIYKLPEFEIDVQGFLVQSTGMEYEVGYLNALKELVAAN